VCKQGCLLRKLRLTVKGFILI